jgi:phosphatidylglycerophosphate synthase
MQAAWQRPAAPRNICVPMLTVRSFFTAVFTPVARRLTSVHPNTLTALSAAAGVLAGAAFALAGRSPWLYVLAGALVALSGSADALDGLVARLSGRASVSGDFFDHLADRVVEVGILGGIALSPGASTPLGLAVVILTLVHSDLGTQIQASFGARLYAGAGKAEQFLGIITFAAVLAIVPDGALDVGPVHLSLANLFFVLLAAIVAAAFGHRLTHALALARTHRSSGPPDRP